jgi:glyoxylase-like metal-dependent hydrolase (beta-lactamase superfamily II)
MSLLVEQFRVGSLYVAALSDGVGQLWPADWFPGVEEAAWMAAVGAASPRAPLPVNFGSFLVRGGGHTVLIDTGNGERTRGQYEGAAGLLDRMAELGVQPHDIDTVLLTHFHGDHVGWNVHGEGGELTFPHATFFLHEADVAYLEDPGSPDSDGNRFSRSRVRPVRDAGRLETFAGEFAPRPGLTFVPTPGHTPGHCSVLIASGGERLLVAGDAAPNVAHLEHPEWTPVYDLDGPRAAASRRALAERAIGEGALVTGGHFPILTIGRLARAEHDFRFERAAVERVAIEARP